MFVSIVIASIARASLARTVESVLSQDIPADQFEIIVVNDSGGPLPLAPWQTSDRVSILSTPKRERCFARNAGASIAKGDYLLFLDDDDWLLPGALTAFSAAAVNGSAIWIHGRSQFMDAKENLVAEHQLRAGRNCLVQLIGGDWIPLSAFIVKSDAFFDVGGFDPRIAINQHTDLCRRLALRWDAEKTDAIVTALLRDRSNSTTSYKHFDYYNFLSRDQLLSQSGAFTRINGSITDSYWAGKFVRSYLVCAWSHLKQRCICISLSRFLGAVAAGLLNIRHAIRPQFWNSLLHIHHRQGIS